jgi:predicted nucleic acid-binding protein
MNNPQIVIDASVAVAFALNDEPHYAKAVALIENFAARGVILCAPAIFDYECESVIRRRVFLKTLSPDDAEEVRAIVAALAVDVTHDHGILARAYQIATVHGQPRTYDASYAAFAEARGLELWTDDQRFYNAVKNGLPFVKYVGHLRSIQRGNYRGRKRE